MIYDWIEDNLQLYFEENELTEKEKEQLTLFENFEYIGKKRTVDGESFFVYQMKNIKDEYIKEFITGILENIERNQNGVSISQIFKKVEDTFKYGRLPVEEEKLRGDLGEILFLHFLEKNGVNWESYYAANENNLFDIQTNTMNIEIKSFCSTKKTIKTSWNQLIPGDNKERFYIVIEIQKSRNEKNIKELLDSLKYQNESTQLMRDYWEKFPSDFLNSMTGDETNKICFLKNSILPKISITPTACFVNAHIELNISSALDTPLNDVSFSSMEELEEILKNK
ncbi:MAG: hypothetical protein LBC44_00755 [Mycoplasmataceae bacterium]|nr:hypothetical protein [Mycoplasmataceae bacterium]